MPITYSFDQERSLILTRVTGRLSISITEDYFARLEQDEDCPADAIEVVDFSGVTDFALQFGEMRRITQTYQRTRSTRNIRATIFACTSDLSYGIARMLQALHDIANKRHSVIITASEEELATCIRELRRNRPGAAEALVPDGPDILPK